jgi:hypothetical protein
MLSYREVSEEEFFRILKERKAYVPEYWEKYYFSKNRGDSQVQGEEVPSQVSSSGVFPQGVEDK